MVKYCTHCHRNVPVEDFATRKKSIDGLAGWCRECHRVYGKQRYQGMKKEFRENNNAFRDRNRERMAHYLASRCCMDCGESDPVVLEFDHREDKKFHISEGLGRMSFTNLKIELAKCDIRCANCHRRKTALAAGYYRTRTYAPEPLLFRDSSDDGTPPMVSVATPMELTLLDPDEELHEEFERCWGTR